MSLRFPLGWLSPTDLFKPHLPCVNHPSNLVGFLAGLRTKLAWSERYVAILTPDGAATLIPTPKAGTMPEVQVEPMRRLFSASQLNITVISYTELEAIRKDAARCIPMLGTLVGLAYVGHRVLVFEGHPSAFETVVAGSDVLLIDSGMLPFLHPGWFDAASRVMPAGSKILQFDRKCHQVYPVVKSKSSPGWKTTEPDGEGSYANCLLTTLAKLPPEPVQLVVGQSPPDLRLLASDPDECEWVAELPFQYEALDSEKVINVIRQLGRWKTLTIPSKQTLQTKLATSGGLHAVFFELTFTEDAPGRTRLEILRRAAS